MPWMVVTPGKQMLETEQKQVENCSSSSIGLHKLGQVGLQHGAVNRAERPAQRKKWLSNIYDIMFQTQPNTAAHHRAKPCKMQMYIQPDLEDNTCHSLTLNWHIMEASISGGYSLQASKHTSAQTLRFHPFATKICPTPTRSLFASKSAGEKKVLGFWSQLSCTKVTQSFSTPARLGSLLKPWWHMSCTKLRWTSCQDSNDLVDDISWNQFPNRKQ